MNKKSAKGTLNDLFMFLIGLFSGSNLIYLFVAGSTPISPSLVISMLCLVWLLVSGQLKGAFVRQLPFDIKALFVGIMLSIIPVLLFHLEYLRQFFVGFIYFMLSASTFLCVFVLGGHKKTLFAGVLFAVGLNILIVLLEFAFYQKGVAISRDGVSSFNFGSFFPASPVAPIFLSNSYSAKGLFREQGHLMRYIAIYFLPLCSVFFKKGRGVRNACLSIVLIVLSAMTRSASFGILIFGLLVYFLVTFRRKPTIIIGAVLGSLFALLLLVFLSNRISFLRTIVDYGTRGIKDLFQTDGSNGGRLDGMKYGLLIVKDYLFLGVGWNVFTKVFQDYGFYGDGILGSYSALVTLLAEIGFVSCFFIFFVLDKAFWLLFRSKTNYQVCIGVSLLIFFALFSSTDFSFEPSNAILLALAAFEFSKVRSDRVLGRINETRLISRSVSDFR